MAPCLESPSHVLVPPILFPHDLPPTYCCKIEIGVLIARSLFPIHPLAAAIQSISVCRRDLEGDKSIGTGQTILPAVLLHGSFDFALMVASFWVAVHPDDADLEARAELGSLFAATAVALFGLLYYVREGRAQKERLRVLDEKAGSSGRGGYGSSAMKHTLV